MSGDYEAPVAAAHVKPRVVKWAWRSVLPVGMISVVAGVPGSQKSLFGVLVAAEISRRADVILSDVEDPPHEVTVPRLLAARAKLDRVTLWTPWVGSGVDLAELRAHIVTMGVRLLVLDPLTAHIPATRRALLPLAKMAHETGCAVLALHHLTKGNPSLDALARIAGPTSGAIGTARAVFAFGEHPDASGERVLAPVKVNLSAEPLAMSFGLSVRRVQTDDFDGEVPSLSLIDTESDVTADEIVRGRRAYDRVSAPGVAAAAEWLTNYLRHGPRSMAQVVEDATRVGHGRRGLHEAARLIGLSLRYDTDVREERWHLPEKHPFARPG